MKKIVLAFDSFKGSLTSLEVAEAAEQGFRALYPDVEIEKVPVADGGEGTTEAITDALQGTYHTALVSDPLGRPVLARYGIIEEEVGVMCAVLEMASASGLPLLSLGERNPWLTSTYGTGELIAHALRQGVCRFYIGIGGSATNDGGMGMMSALGARFYDAEGNLLQGRGMDLELVARIDLSHLMPEACDAEFIVACDVDTPFCGEEGAAWMFARQKGASEEMINRLDRGMSWFAERIEEATHIDVSRMEGAGAAGGLGGAFCAFLNARLTKGVEMVLDAVHFDRFLQGADLVLTGEGRMDAQTAHGKTPIGVLRHSKEQGVPVVALCGAVVTSDLPKLESLGFKKIIQVTPPSQPLNMAMKKNVAKENVSRAIMNLLDAPLSFPSDE